MDNPKEEVAGGEFQFEYVTSAVSMLPGEGIVVHVVNDSGASENVRVVLYKNTGPGAIVITDSGRTAVGSTWTWGSAYTTKEPGEYWLRIQVTSESLVPSARFTRHTAGIWVAYESYRPGDFATFSLARRRMF